MDHNKEETKLEHIELDEALSRVGGYRRFNIFAFLVLSTSVTMPLCWQGLSIIFIGWEPPHHCAINKSQWMNTSIPLTAEGKLEKCQVYVDYKTSNRTEECDSWQYEDQNYKTIVTEFDLVCSNNYLSEMSQTVYQIGCLSAEMTASYLTDRFGRKRVHIVAQLGIVLFGISTSFVQNYIWFVVLRTITGMFVVGAVISGIVLMLELFDSTRRSLPGMGLEFLWLFVYAWLPLMAMYIENWRYLQITISSMCIIWVVLHWVMVESPQWLVSYKRYKDAEKVLKTMAKWNKAPPPDFTLVKDEDLEEDEKAIPLKVPITNLFMDAKLRLHFFVANFLWFSNSIVYYGLILATPSMSGNRFLNFFLSGVAELPAYIIAYFAVDKIGRRMPTCAFHLLAGVPMAIVPFIPEKSGDTDLSMLINALVLLAKFGITGSFAVIVMYTREVFPANIRGSASGYTNILGRVGNMIAPFMAYLAKYMFWLSNVIFAIISVVAGLSALLLPETVNKPSPTNLEDMYRILYPKIWNSRLERRRSRRASSIKRDIDKFQKKLSPRESGL